MSEIEYSERSTSPGSLFPWIFSKILIWWMIKPGGKEEASAVLILSGSIISESQKSPISAVLVKPRGRGEARLMTGLGLKPSL